MAGTAELERPVPEIQKTLAAVATVQFTLTVGVAATTTVSAQAPCMLVAGALAATLAPHKAVTNDDDDDKEEETWQLFLKLPLH